MKLAVLGSPIAHSKSPQIHRAAYRAMQLDWEYQKIECVETALEEFLDGLDEAWRGLSLTMPLKEEAYRLSSSHCEWAQKSGVVNTLLLKNGERHGFNTDIPGLAAAIEETGVLHERVALLGAGATAESAIHSLRLLGVEDITVFARRKESAEVLAEKHEVSARALGEELPDATKLTLSTLPPDSGAEKLLPAAFFKTDLFDVSYNPWPSELAEAWQREGSKTVSGISMLYMQALYQIRIFVAADPLKPLAHENEILAKMREAALAS